MPGCPLPTGLVHGENTAAAVEVGEVPGQHRPPAARCDALGEHGVEHQAACGGQHEAALGAPQAGRRSRRPLEVGAITAEALRSEVIRHAAARDRLQARPEQRRQTRAIAAADADAHPEAIAGERTARQLAVVRVRLEDLELRAAYPAPGGGGGTAARHGEPLHGDRAPVLETCVPHLGGTAAGVACQLLRHPGRVGGVLADPQQQVLACAGGREAEVLLHHEVFRLRAQDARSRRRTVSARRRERRSAAAALGLRHS
jgi:hypothetical protein